MTAYYVCTAGTITVHLALELIERLNRDAVIALKSLPKRGLEIGGVLLGRIEHHGSVTSIFVDGCSSFEASHAMGPSYVLGEGDLTKWDERISALNSAREATPVGWYRSHTRRELEPADEDGRLTQRSFPGTDKLLLLVKPAYEGAGTGAIFLPGEAVDPGSWPVRVFPFHPADLRAGGFEIRQVGGAAVPTAAEKALVRPAAPLEVKASGSRRALRRGLLWASVAAALALFTSTALRLKEKELSDPRPTLLSLRAEHANGAIRLLWNRESRALDRVERAVLTIQDGSLQRRLDLSPGQLQAGSVTYFPLSHDLNFDMEVFGTGGKWNESLRTFGGPERLNASIVNAAPPDPSTADRQLASVPRAPATEPTAPRVMASERGASSESDGISERQGDADRGGWTRLRPAARIPLVPVPARTGKPPVNSIPPPPDDIARVTPVAELPPAAAPRFPRTQDEAAEARARGTSVEVEPAAPNRFLRALLKVPGFRALQRGRHKAGDRFVAAKATRRALPTVPPSISHRLTQEVAIDVKATVDEKGNVDRPELLSDEAPRQLLVRAVDALRRWRFEPATLDEKPVESEVIFHFRFRDPRRAESAAVR